MNLLFVGDGPRDARTTPALVERILGRSVGRGGAKHWLDIQVRGTGYDRKLVFAMRSAIDDGLDGVVATLDRDRAPTGSRLAGLKEGRARERTDPMSPAAFLPTAVGEAAPHAEAWLLDDVVAVREGLSLDGNVEVPNVRRERSPKETLDALHRASPRSPDSPLDVLEAVARAVVPDRCVHAKDTGFEAFAVDVKAELGPLQ